MVRAIIDGQRKVVLQEVNGLKPNEDEILLRIDCSILGPRELRGWLAGDNAGLGRNFSGVVEQIGSNVKKFEKNDAIMVTAGSGCHSCYHCMRGRENYCDNFENVINGLADYVILSKDIIEHNAYIKPQELSFTQVAFLDIIASSVQSLKKIQVLEGDTVVILGCGLEGLIELSVLRAQATFKKVIVVGTNNQNLELAKTLGADYAINADEVDVKKAIRELTEGYGAQVIIDCAGIPAYWDIMLNLASKAATLLFCGVTTSDYKLPLDTIRIHYDQMTIVGSKDYTSESVAKAKELLIDGKINTLALVKDSLPLDEAKLTESFEMLEKGEGISFAILPNLCI